MRELVCLGYGVKYAVQAGGAPEPEISVKRSPRMPVTEVVTQVTLEGTDGLWV